jgi:hypothetical protein
MVLAAWSWGEIGCGLAAVAALHLASGTGPAAALRSLRPFRFLLLFTLVVQAWFTGGAPLRACSRLRHRHGPAVLAATRLAESLLPRTWCATSLELARSIGGRWAVGAPRDAGARGDS